MEDLMLKVNLESLKKYYDEQYIPKSNQEKEKEEEVLKGPCGLWGWILFVRKLRKTH